MPWGGPAFTEPGLGKVPLHRGDKTLGPTLGLAAERGCSDAARCWLVSGQQRFLR